MDSQSRRVFLTVRVILMCAMLMSVFLFCALLVSAGLAGLPGMGAGAGGMPPMPPGMDEAFMQQLAKDDACKTQ